MIFFLTLTVRGLSIGRILSDEKYGDTGFFFFLKKRETLNAGLNERAEAPTSSYSVTGDFLQYIYSVPVTKNHQDIRSQGLVHEFSITDFFNDISHGYRTAIMKKNYLCMLPFYMAVATYFYYKKVHTTMRTAIVSYLLNIVFLRKLGPSHHLFFSN